MAKRYDAASKIDAELRGTVDFDFFESEDIEKSNRDSGVKKSTARNDEKTYYYDDDDDSFESDDDDYVDDKKANKGANSVPAKNDDAKKVIVVTKNNNSTKKQGGGEGSSPERKSKSKSNRARRHSDSSTASDITEVSPLGSRDTSPRQSNRDKKGKTNKKEKVTIKEPDDKLDMDVLMETIMKLEKERAKHDKKNVMFIPTKEDDIDEKNYSFKKGKLDEIERENHRLLHKILNQHTRKKSLSGSAGTAMAPEYAMPPCKRQFHSALNRQKEQRRIEQDNMKILHRLQTVKPTKDITRHEQLKETRKQSMYGIPVHVVNDRPTRRHSDSSMLGVDDETFQDAEWKGETQVNRRAQRPGSAKKTLSEPSQQNGQRPDSGKKRPQWTDRW